MQSAVHLTGVTIHAVPRPDGPDDLAFDVARSGGYVAHTHEVATKISTDPRVVAELADMAHRLSELHGVALVMAGCCAGEKCSAPLTDPASSPSGARHCRSCRVGWTLIEEDGRLRAVAKPWPEGAGS